MRSPDSRRAVMESALRGIALAAMVALAVMFWIGRTASQASAVVSAAGLDSALTAWTASPPQRVTLDATPLPGPGQRDWLRALRRTGSVIEWRTGDSAQLALVAEAGPRPALPQRLVALGRPASTIVLADDLGALDSANAGDDGAAAWRASPVGTVRAHIGRAVAVAEPRDALSVKPVLVVGQAGWETKFVMAALEESGWVVSSRITVAPGAVVRQGASTVLDTASFSAVVVLDSLSELALVVRFVREGGGLVAAGAGVNHPALRTIVPRAMAAVPGELGALLGPNPKEGLQSRRLRPDTSSIILERRANDPTVLAQRVGAGRAVAVGYDDTWRLRLAPPDESAPEVHRAWWSSLVAGVARVSLTRRETGLIDEAPFAATTSALGPPTVDGAPPGSSQFPWTTLLASIAALALLAEWLSRRSRGMA